MVVLCLGCNLGDCHDTIRRMFARLKSFLGPPIKASRLMKTEPVGVAEEQPWYLNLIITGEFTGTARDLLSECQLIEAEHGRVREGGKKPRTADIDVLLFGDEIINDADLIVPHPEIINRRFCLEGLRDIDPALKIPRTGRTVRELHAAMPEKLKMQKIGFSAFMESDSTHQSRDHES